MANHLHFVLIPLMCPGHIIPMVDMAKVLAQHSVSVTVVITPRNAARFSSVLTRAVKLGLPIRILELPFPSVESGLPEGCESVDDIPSFTLVRNFFTASSSLQQPLEQVFENLKPTPTCIISDKHMDWTSDTAKKFGVPWIIFDGMSCFTQLCTHNLYVSKVYENLSDDSTSFIVPDLPDRVELTRAQLPGLFNPGTLHMTDIREKIRAAESRAYGVVINSFYELEKSYVDEYRKVKGDFKVWCIGPLSLINENNLDKAQRGNKASIDANYCLKWLDSRKDVSVIYACLGSLTRITPLQFIELALGLEESKCPFILVVKGGNREDKIEKWVSENGFEERVKGRGLLIRGWAPQVLILSHPAIGGFLTHCGWNSTLEGVCAGVPLITWPSFAEQFFNEKLVVQVLATGVSVGAKVVVHLGEEEKFGVIVRRENVTMAINRVMDVGIEGRERRKRARELGEMAKKAVEEGGSSYLGTKMLIHDIMLQTNNGLSS